VETGAEAVDNTLRGSRALVPRRPVKSVYAILRIAGSMSRNFLCGGFGG